MQAGLVERDKEILSRQLLILLLIVLSNSPFFLHRTGVSRILPLPAVAEQELISEFAKDQARAESLREKQLPANVRAVGEYLRRMQKSNSLSRDAAARSLESALRENLAQGRVEELKQLRAVQSYLFYAAITQGEAADLLDRQELAAGFRPQYFQDAAGKFRFSPLEFNLLYKFHFAKQTGTLNVPQLAPTHNELLAYYRTLLQTPPLPQTASANERARARLPYAEALGRVDPNYPADLTSGILLLQSGSQQAAIYHLAHYLAAHPDGPWVYLAETQLLTAGGKLSR